MSNSGKNSKVKVISPMLAVADMDETLDFYASVLGFTVCMRSAQYSIIEKDGATVHFMKADDESVMKAVRGHTEIYIEVDDIGPLWQHVQAYRGQYKITELSERDYGMTEFHINDPNDCLIFVGQETRKPPGME
ncbi:VOC family protein [Phragmitibacter flavus]|nr:VOC family protein [Phragmitibacter flavus]